MTFKIDINGKWCKKCGLCAHYCPKKVFDRDDFGAPMATRAQACVGCKACESRCPDFAIEVMPV
jgi:2-oxoglutarate ferredoxin oxidoreductase subunit delta